VDKIGELKIKNPSWCAGAKMKKASTLQLSPLNNFSLTPTTTARCVLQMLAHFSQLADISK